ncbi:MAG: hypothetical protein GXO25_05910 [Euryarchaeota archaeon]|nr:hypothetical protein [Euryarchaeota archaeon]
MKLSRKLILNTATQLRQKRGRFTQVELHTEIEKRIGRALTVNEKRRVTMIIRNEFVIDEVERDKQNGYMRIYVFL